MEQLTLDENVKIEFTPDQIGYVLNVLRKQQYDQVASIISSVEKQVLSQARQRQITVPSNGTTIPSEQ